MFNLDAGLIAWRATMLSLAFCIGLLPSCSNSDNTGQFDALDNQIVFESTRDRQRSPGDQDIYRINPDGSGLQRLTDTQQDEADPSVSPDGRSIAYSFGGPGEDIYIMNADGTNPRQITRYRGTDYRPAWSPDGHTLVFTSERSGRYGLFTIDSDGNHRVALTHRPLGNDWVSSGAFSPDGKRLVYEQWDREHLQADLCIINADGTAAKKVHTGIPISRSAAWSPDGKQIAFVGAQKRLSGHALYVINIDGSGLQRLVGLHSEATVPAWSPDSSQLVFENRIAAGDRLFLINRDGSGYKQLTQQDAGSPHWSRARADPP